MPLSNRFPSDHFHSIIIGIVNNTLMHIGGITKKGFGFSKWDFSHFLGFYVVVEKHE